MKKLNIAAGQVALVINKNRYAGILTEGSYWNNPFREYFVYDMTKPFAPFIDLNILMKNEELASMIILIDVLDNEIVVKYENGVFKEVLKPGRYAFWKGVVNYRFNRYDCSGTEAIENVDQNILMRREMYEYIRVQTVDAHEIGLLVVENSIRMLNPGTYFFWRNPKPINVLKADKRNQQMEISGQEILTRDKAAVRINFFINYKMIDAMKALAYNKDSEKQLYVNLQLALREFIGAMTLDEMLDKKDAVNEQVLTSAKDSANQMGYELISCGIRDVILPGDMKDIMNQVLVAEKRAQANMIMRREETAATRSLLNTAKLMEDNQMLFRLKEMEYVEKIAEKVNNISLGNGNLISDQLKEMFVRNK